jgi:hypothetical protein
MGHNISMEECLLLNCTTESSHQQKFYKILTQPEQDSEFNHIYNKRNLG